MKKTLLYILFLLPILIFSQVSSILNSAIFCIPEISKETVSVWKSNEALTATVDILQPNCNNPTGVVSINAKGGSGGYNYSLDNGITYIKTNTFTVVQPGTYTIKVRDSNNDVYSLIITVTTPVDTLTFTTTIVSPSSCSATGEITVTAIAGQSPYMYSLDGTAFQTNNAFKNLSSGNYLITVKDSSGCTQYMSVTLQEPNPLTASVIIKNQTVTIDAKGGTGTIMYAISPNLYQFSTKNTFSNLNYGTYTLIIQDEKGCFIVKEIRVTPIAPVINGKSEIILEFKSGQTLGDLAVEGQNIKWYSSKGSPTSKIAETSLPLSTILVDDVTYYASQTIDGIESIDRLAVTAKLNGSLSTPDFEFANLNFYPNPVKQILNIKNQSIIENIQIFSVSGQSILFKKVDNTHSEIDLSSLSKGLYILNVKSNGKEKAFKFIKE